MLMIFFPTKFHMIHFVTAIICKVNADFAWLLLFYIPQKSYHNKSWIFFEDELLHKNVWILY